jgi:putative redox protein
MKARIKLIDGMAFLGESGSGHSVVMDGAPEYGGRNIGIRPMEMLLIGLGGCTAFDVVQILRRGREDVTDCEIDVSAERAGTDPKVFTAIHLDYRVKGRNLAPAKVERAIELSKEKYCSASIMLGAVAKITYDWSVTEDGMASGIDA